MGLGAFPPLHLLLPRSLRPLEWWATVSFPKGPPGIRLNGAGRARGKLADTREEEKLSPGP